MNGALPSRLPAPRIAGRGGILAAGIAFAVILAMAGAASLPGQSNPPPRAQAKGAPQVVELRIGDEIEPVMAEYVDNGIAEAARRQASLVLITMDTPGGLSTSMEDIIRHILDSPVPVAIYV
ncbi:MAG: NfeD family protein, partial [Candidatus Acidiferrales bacterium]